MKKIYLTTLLATLFCVVGAVAQTTIYSVPPILQQTSQNVKVYFNASGTPLENLDPEIPVYCHTGVYTQKSPKTWVYTSTWGKNDDQYLLTNEGNNLYMLYIGNIREYYNITNAEEIVTSLNFVFRTGDAKTQTKDLFLPVYDEGLQVSLTSDSNGEIITGETGYVTFTVYSTQVADLTLTVNEEVVASAPGQQQLEYSYTFTGPGEYVVTAYASSNGETVEETMVYQYIGNSIAMDYPGGTPKMGPVANNDGSVTFCLGAPQKKHVVIVGSWNDYAYTPLQVMNYQDTENGRYFWCTVEGLDPAEKYVYYFVVDGGEHIVGDPYARLVLDPNNDKSLATNLMKNLPDYPEDQLNGQKIPVGIYQGTLNDYDWQCTDFVAPDKTNLMIYELLLRDFTGTEGLSKGNGTINQAMSKFSYLKKLGVNAIELLPINEFNGNNSWGYNPNFYFAPDKAYGSPDDYKNFIDLCHRNGIAVILDLVFNQSDGLHPWCQMYEWRSNPFYNSSYAGENGAPHAYGVLNDWNQDMPMVQEQWKDVIEYWMTEYKVDGFRFDLVKGLGDNESYATSSNLDTATEAYNASRVARMAYLNSIITGINPNGYCINENFAGSKEENEMAKDGELNWSNVNNESCQYAMGYQSGSNMNKFLAIQAARNAFSTVSYMESHDEERLAYKQDQWGVEGVKGNVEVSMQRCGSAAAQMIMTPGSHMIWMFSEMGNAQSTKNSNGGNNTSPKKVNWDLLNEPNHRGLYDNYCEMIQIRNNNPEFFSADANFQIKCGQSNWAQGRTLFSTYQDKELLTFVNPNVDKSITFEYAFNGTSNDDYKILSQSYGSVSFYNVAEGTVTVPANCYVIIGNNTVEDSGVEGIEAEKVKSLIVHGGNGEVIVNYAAQPATVYSLDGKVMGQVAESGSVVVSKGLYIVKSGKESVKVIVR